MNSFSNSCAVIIGIDTYGCGIPPLKTAVNDATSLAELLETKHGYKVNCLTQNVTGDRLMKLFTMQLPGSLDENSRLFVYFAGHGIALDGEDGPAGYLIPEDARADDISTFLAMTDLHKWLTDLPCRHMLAVLDCCFAGAFRWTSTRYIGAPPKIVHKERYDRYIQSPAWQVITSASYDQRALDLLEKGDVTKLVGTRKEDSCQHSPFAAALIAGLQGEADLIPKKCGDGVITANELAIYLRQEVEVEAAQQAQIEQTPQIWPLNKHRKGEFIFLVPDHPLNLPAAEALNEQNNPYRGLQPYEREHQELFFGRKEEMEHLLCLLEQKTFVTVVGASGTGKSSLVKAGLLPRLENSGGGWQVLPPMRPTDHPIQALAKILQSSLPGIPINLNAKVGLARAVAAWKVDHPKMRLVLTVDQCEELITLCQDEKERAGFLTLLSSAIHQHPDEFRLVITLRTDFEPQLKSLGLFTDLISSDSRYMIPPMGQDDLRDVIEGPASVRVLYFEPPELVDMLINEVVQMPGALPLLSFTLSEMYLHYVRSGRDDRALTRADYEALGGVIGSLRHRANEEYDAIPDEQLTMQSVMLRMISIEGGGLARRRVMKSELNYPTAEENRRVKHVLDRLEAARLLVSGQESDAAEAYVELAHDALVVAWDRLLEWKLKAEDNLPLQRRTAQAAIEWERAPEKEKAGLLWNDDPRLPQLERALSPVGQAAEHGPLARLRRELWPDAANPRSTAWLNRCELAFVQASVKRRSAVLRQIIGITAAVIIALAALSVVALWQAAVARSQEAIALSQKATAEHETVIRTTAEAVALSQKAEAELQLRRLRSSELAKQAVSALEGSKPDLALLLAQQAVNTTYRVDGTILPQAKAALQRVLASPFRRVFLDPLTTSQNLSMVLSGPVASPDGSFFVSSNIARKGLLLYDASRQKIADLEGSEAFISPTSTLIITVDQPPAGQSGRFIRIYRIQNDGSLQNKKIVSFSNQFIVSQSKVYPPGFIENDQRLLFLVCMQSGAEQSCENIKLQERSLDGSLLAEHGLVRESRPQVDAALSGDGSRVVTVNDKGEIDLWDRAGNLLKKITSLAAKSARLNRDGSRILAWAPSEQDLGMSSIKLLDETGRTLTTKPGVSADIAPSGSRFATIDKDNKINVWDEGGNLLAQFTAHNGDVESVSFTPDGRYLITSGCDSQRINGSVCQTPSTRFWAFDDLLGMDLIDHGDSILSLQPAPDGVHILSIECKNIGLDSLGITKECHPSTNGLRAASIWNLANQAEAPLGNQGEYVIAAQYNRIGDQVMLLECAPGTDAGNCLQPRLAGHKLDGQPTNQSADPHLASISDGDVSPDGLYLLFLHPTPAPGSKLDQEPHLAKLYLWNISSSEWISAGDAQNDYAWASFSPDGVHIAAVDKIGDDQTSSTVFLWDLKGNLVTTAALDPSQNPGNIWGRFSPDGQRIALVGCRFKPMGFCNDSTLFLWDLSSNQIRNIDAGTGVISSLEFSPDGKFLVVVNQYGNLVEIWDTSVPGVEKLHATLSGFTAAPRLAAFRRQGDILLTVHSDNSLRLWDPDGNSLGDFKPFGAWLSLASFSGDGNDVIAVGCDANLDPTGTSQLEHLRIWSLWQSPEEMLAEAKSRLAGTDFTPQECQSYQNYLDAQVCP